MAVVARLLPRHWDGCRLLRFLTGLALLALAFAVRIDTHAAPAPSDVARAPAVAAPAVTEPGDASKGVREGARRAGERESAPVHEAAQVHPAAGDVGETRAGRPNLVAFAILVAGGAAHPGGATPRASGPRAPPIA
ncbi:hypothetical protein [Krasilnikovia sp. M28-CT-15]|uniref:hypothetical protein n=1 Tax=Krasilnikovia sp. M28-CT-15 TaxID=3373540 RepID=UPI00387675DB